MAGWRSSRLPDHELPHEATWDPRDSELWVAEVTRVGRWRYEVILRSGLLVWGRQGADGGTPQPFRVWGGKRADRLGYRLLMRLRRRLDTEHDRRPKVIR